MALPGSEQQRLKTQNEFLAERRSLEYEINKLVQERLDVQEKYGRLDAALTAKMQASYQKLEDSGQKRLSLEAKVAKLTEKLEHSGGVRAQRFKALIQQRERQIRDLKATEAIEKIELDIINDQIKAVMKQRELESKIRLEEERRFEKGMSYVGKLGNVFKAQETHYKNLKASTTLQGKQLMLAASLLAVFQMMTETFKVMDAGFAKFRIAMGMLRSDAKRIQGTIQEVATQFAHVGVSIDGAAAAVMALANEFGGTMKVSQDLVETTSLFRAQLGVAEEASAGFLRNMGALTRSTAQSQIHMAYLANEMTAAAGIPLNLVMQDVAKLSGNALAMISKMPMAIVKSAVAARQMGTTINKMADASANLLNFTESVQAEMDASVLVGQAINLQQARQLAYQGKIVESTQAIVAEAKRINFERLDYFQMQAFATASGRSADELLRMIQAQRQLQEARNIAGLKDEVALYDQLQASRASELKDRDLQRALQVKQMANQARLDQLQNQWNQLWMETMRVMFPALDILLKIGIAAIRLGPPITFLVVTMEKFFNISFLIANYWSKFQTAMAMGILAGSKFFTLLSTVGSKIAGIFTGVAKFSNLFKIFSFAAPFTKAIPVIGWIITGFQLVWSFIKNIRKNMAGGDNFLVAGIKAAGQALYEVFLKPFKFVWDWIMKLFGPGSPSKMMVQIISGIANGAAKMFDVLTYPWRMFLAWIVDKIPFMGGVAKKIRGGMTGIMSDMGLGMEKEAAENVKPVKVATEATATPTAAATVVQSPEEQARREQDSTSLTNILTAIKELNANLVSGKIGIYLDGQLVSATLARQTQFKGGYGVNNV